MIQIIHYKQENGIISVGFKKHNFVVYGQMGVIEGYSKVQYLQKLYEQCKSALDYETDRYNRKLSNSIISNEEGEEFIPERSKPSKVFIEVENNHIQFEEGQESANIYLLIIVKDQYNEGVDANVNCISSIGVIEDDALIVPKIYEDTEVTITARIGDIEDTKIVYLYPCIEQRPSAEQIKIQELEQQLLDVQAYIVNKQYEELLQEGGL